MAKKNGNLSNVYEEKRVNSVDAANYSSFGWKKVKNAMPVPGKHGEKLYSVRRNVAFSANPTLVGYENEYAKYAKKQKKASGKGSGASIFFTALFMVIFLAVAVVGLVPGLMDGLDADRTTELQALYNAAVDYDKLQGEEDIKLVNDEEAVKFFYDEDEEGIFIEDEEGELVAASSNAAFYAFVKANPTIDTFADLYNAYITYDEDGEIDTEPDAKKLTGFFTKALEDLGVEDAAEEFDSSCEPNADGEYVAETGALDGIVDMLRPYLALVNLDGTIAGLGLPAIVNTNVIIGAVGLIIFIALLISLCVKAGRKSKKEELASGMLSARENAENLVNQMKIQDKSLMTKGERKMYAWETMITRAIKNAKGGEEAGGDDDDDDDF